ncbi:VCBS repeat-containing protein [Myxococcus sp. CA033]|nr:VCBS repeat-containing protein [Myxococcus sp. CA033]
MIGAFDYPDRVTADAGDSDDFPNIDKTEVALNELGRVGFNTLILDMQDLTAADLDKLELRGVHALAKAWNWSHRGEGESELHWVREVAAQHHVGSDLDLKIQELKAKPALLGYDSMDEMGWNKDGGGQIVWDGGAIDGPKTDSNRARIPTVEEATSFRAFVNERDPAHHVYYTEIAANDAEGVAAWEGIPGFPASEYRKWRAAANAWGQDRYPISLLPGGGSPPFPLAPLNHPAESIEAMKVLHDDNFVAPYSPAGPILIVLQGQGYAECCSSHMGPTIGRRPNYTETRFMAYSSIIHEARGIFWWGTENIEQDSQLWWDIKKVASQLRILEPALLSDETYALGGFAPDAGAGQLEGIRSTIGQHNILIVANRTPTAVTGPITPVAWNGTSPARPLFEQRSSILYNSSQGGWTDTFGPWEVHVYTDAPIYGRKDDFDGDGKSDFTWYWESPAMPQTGLLTVQASSLPRPMRFPGGLPGDISLTGDYDGDGLTDFAVYTPAENSNAAGFFTVWRSRGQHWSWFDYGEQGDIPIAADYDGDGTTDIAVYHHFTAPESTPSGLYYGEFRWLSSLDGLPQTFLMGEPDDTPIVGDFDGDGLDNFAMYKHKAGTGWGGWFTVWKPAENAWDWDTMGQVGDIPVVGDYDGDGRSDLALYTPRWPTNDGGGYFTYVHSSTGTSYVKFLGGVGDVPVTGDYDGDSKTDIAVYTPRTSSPAAGGYYTITFSGSQITSTRSRAGVRTGELPMGREWQQ